MLSSTLHPRLPRRTLVARFALALLLVGALSACSPAPSSVGSTAGNPSNVGPGHASVTSPNATEQPESKSEGVEETWDICAIRGTKIGYVHARIVPIVEGDRRLLRMEFEQVLSFRRFGQTTQDQVVAITSWETPDGQLDRFECRMTAGREFTLTRGRVDGKQLRVTTITPGKAEESTRAWNPEWGGFFATELQLKAKPLKPRERRTHKSLMPILFQMAESQLEGIGYEAVRIGESSEQLLKIRKTDQIGNRRIESTIWMDERGDVRRQFMPVPSPGLTVERSTREAALAEAEGVEFDLGEQSVVRLTEPLQVAPITSRRIVYQARLKDQPIRDVFAKGASQSVREIDEHRVELTVRAVRPHQPEELSAPETAPVDADSKPNSLIQSDDPRIVAMARSVLPEETDSWKVAVALEQFVQQTIRSKNFSQAFATAAEVAQSREGDCTEHSVLLAALCRARQIPARVAIGLVYVPRYQGFAYHMWNEVWIRDRWIPLDGTLGQQGIGAAHLKLVTSHLQGEDAYGAFLPVFQVLGQLELSVTSQE